MRVERSTLDQVKKRFEVNKKKMEEKQKDYDFEERMKELREEEEKAKAYKKEKQKEKKRRAEEDLTFEEDDEMAAVMGFSGFGSTKKSYWGSLFGLTLAYTGPNFVCVCWGGRGVSSLETGESP